VVASSFPLAALFLPHLPAGARPAPAGDEAALETVLAGWLAAARAAWPEVALAPERFLPYAAVRVGRAAIADLAAVHASDLYVACACADGDVRAIVALEARHFGTLDAAVRRMRLPVSPEEVRQELRIHLFVAGDGATPRIDQYNGKGDLVAWLRVSATRAALRLQRRRLSDGDSDNDRLTRLAARDVEPELMHVRATMTPIFGSAFAAALASLTARQRTLLQHHYVDELSTDRIGAIYGVHRATAARWVVQARAELLTALRQRIAASLDSDVDDVDSLLRYVKSHLEITLSRLLGSGAADEPGG
jgi:RNA polymerase sigma-70 factor (ECF subfamily)